MITMLSLAGIVVGVAAIICVASIFNGFREVYTQSMLAYDPHVRVEARSGRYILQQQQVDSVLRNNANIKVATRVVSGRIVLRRQQRFQVVQIHGIEPSSFSAVSGIRNSIIVGDFLSAKPPATAMAELVIGAELAMNAQLSVGDTATLLSPDFVSEALQSFMNPEGIPVVIRGLFTTNSKEYNAAYAYTDATTARRLLRIPDSAFSAVDLHLYGNDRAEPVAEQLRKELPPQATALTWFDLHKDLYGVMRFERFASFIVLFIIILVSVFNIFAMLSMTIVKKQRDIGTLMAMGATPGDIQSIFLWEGCIIGAGGTLLGSVLGITLCLLQQHFEIIRFDPQSFIIAAVPVSLAWPEVIAIILLTVLSSLLATIYPARRAARTLVSQALRTE
ncbi:MAG: hypothetical protein RL156_643 [Bacteroidota bacterium]